MDGLEFDVPSDDDGGASARVLLLPVVSDDVIICKFYSVFVTQFSLGNQGYVYLMG